MSTRAYGSITAANTVDFELEADVVALRVVSDVNVTVVTYVDSARTKAATTAPTPATTVVVSDRAMGRFVRVTSTSPTYIEVLVEDA